MDAHRTKVRLGTICFARLASEAILLFTMDMRHFKVLRLYGSLVGA